jgi:hypothetical protein
MEDVGDSDVTICDRIFTMCLMGYKSLDYDMYVWTALILIQFLCLVVSLSSIAGKIVVGFACASGFGLYLFYTMLCSLIT